MPTIAILLAFAVPVIVYVAIPGPAVLYIVATGIQQGRGVGIVAALGLGLGTLIHVMLAIVGLSALIASSTVLFTIVKYAGAGYLIWLGASKLGKRIVPPCVIAGAPPSSLRTVFGRGLAIQMLNLGTILFMLALLPQFVDSSNGSTVNQMLILGIALVAIELTGNCMFALGSGAVAVWLGRHPKANLHCGRFSGLVYLTLGFVVVVSTSGMAG